MDYIALSGVNCFLRRRKNILRMIIISIVASLLGLVFTLFIMNTDLRILIMHFVLNTAMVFFCFGGTNKKEFLENWTVTYLVVIFLGGIMEAERENHVFEHLFFLQALIAAGVLSITTWYLGRRKQFGNQIFPVVLKNHGKVIEVRGYWDSGNQLRDPFNGKAICIVNKAVSDKIRNLELDVVRLIPYTSLGKSDGLIPVITIDSIKIYDGKKVMERKEAEIGIAEEKLFENKEYEVILHASL